MAHEDGSTGDRPRDELWNPVEARSHTQLRYTQHDAFLMLDLGVQPLVVRSFGTIDEVLG
jgi:hypothetical protein